MAGAGRGSVTIGDAIESIQNDSAALSNEAEHLSDVSSNSLQLTVNKLNGKNYLERAQTVKLVIDGKGKLGYLTSEVKKPANNDLRLKSWRSENSMVIAWLINLMESSIGKSFLFIPTTKEVWDVVHDTYSDLENSSQILELKTKLWQSRQGDREVTMYFNEMDLDSEKTIGNAKQSGGLYFFEDGSELEGQAHRESESEDSCVGDVFQIEPEPPVLVEFTPDQPIPSALENQDTATIPSAPENQDTASIDQHLNRDTAATDQHLNQNTTAIDQDSEIPKNVQDALRVPEWKEVILEEKRALEKNETWEVVDLPKGNKTVGCKWVFTIKYNVDGTLERYKP
ncbi:hypothetical protein CK203_052984 [Vitis vinifera]|uniref:Mitochondrial protein n=1 Tax=Vitis vinifera TaxID=29760 RepID=A0A438GML9_VITVI|nr:hypothetical protein CK203_052984 [Vitis vinifera]